MKEEGLRGRVVLVTGSGRGLGAAIARAAAAEGARVVLNCHRDGTGLEALARELSAAGAEALAVAADVTVFDEARQLVERTVGRWGRLDVLVNTVGGMRWKALADLEPAEWRRLVASNLDSVFHMCRLAVPRMREQRFGRIVNLAAVGAAHTQGEPQMAAYSAAKAAVVALSRALALEEARRGITVNVVSPGLLDDEPGAAPPGATASPRAAAPAAPATSALPKALEDRVPVGHAGHASDVVRAVLFFASPAAEFVTGQVIEVAGGARS
ncbi:MAG TPA: SDR family NAD(P)-dependent oxidoreductase [Vicinamibacteria bacterium]|nr:SDR family NAD(P)-dependent oxidoreductase [Vicinamibacteria bacterium]